MVMEWFKKKVGGAKPARKTGGPALELSALLDNDLILRVDEKVNKEQLIERLVTTLCERRQLGAAKPFLRKVLEREQGISTTLDTGLAVPHARLDELPKISAILALVPQGLTDPKQPDLTIRAMFLFFSPNRKEAFTQHLHLLRGVSSMFQPEFIDEILGAADARAVLKLISDKELSA